MLKDIENKIEDLNKLLGRYLDNHCARADAEGMSTLCECQICLDTRVVREELAALKRKENETNS